ncbi:EAL domain-containing protein [Dactylosporangium sp. McL0621]|uniref:EAL domain-containing protein n=1 Tax=Dactylosporangium sp. McL0621 TaxID=3415678 RepID=UPI003CF28590
MVRDRLWIGLLGIGSAATALWAFDVRPGLAFPLVGGLSALAWAFGPRLHDLRPRRPWRLLTAAALLFLVGVVVRALLTDRPYPLAQLGDAFAVCGFACLIAGMATFLSRWGINRHALLDGSIGCIGAAIASALLFVLPATAIPGRPLLVSVLAGLYPLLDVVIGLLGVNLAFTTAIRQPSFMFLGAMMLAIFAGDLGYAIIDRQGRVTGPALLDLPFQLGFTMITESVMVEGGEVTERLLLRLRELGVRISVDDFGTGFSALGYLRRHPVTGVKIDRSFVGGLGAVLEDEEIVRAVVAMSSALNLALVAEGVETTPSATCWRR